MTDNSKQEDIELIRQLLDFPSLQQLSNSLWRNEAGLGQAALFIGARFSRNAILTDPSVAPPPLWSGLTQDMRRKLEPLTSPARSTDPLRTAVEFRAQFGQAGLDAFLRQQVPDAALLPFALHKSTLELPWCDVLTTN